MISSIKRSIAESILQEERLWTDVTAPVILAIEESKILVNSFSLSLREIYLMANWSRRPSKYAREEPKVNW